MIETLSTNKERVLAIYEKHKNGDNQWADEHLPQDVLDVLIEKAEKGEYYSVPPAFVMRFVLEIIDRRNKE